MNKIFGLLLVSFTFIGHYGFSADGSRFDDASLIPLNNSSATVYFDRVDFGVGGTVAAAEANSRTIKDPLEGINRVTFVLNDKMYRYVLSPAGEVYAFVVPVVVRNKIKNFGYNLAFPVRLFGSVFQGQFKDAGNESLRFLINTTLGVAGFFDVAKSFGIPKAEEDMGQAFASWGFGEGFYFVIPLLGPSSLRDGIGTIFDTALNPVTYVPGGSVFFRINDAKVTLRDYFQMTKSEFDPYMFARDMSVIIREKYIRNLERMAFPVKDIDFPTLQAAFFKPLQEDFVDKAKQRSVLNPWTGKKFPYNLWIQKKKSDLAIIIPGIGSNRNGNLVGVLASNLFARGYSVVSISAPLSWEFIEKGALAPFPGYMPFDVRDLGNLIPRIITDVRRKFPERIRDVDVVGFSSGGMHSIYLAEELSQRNMDGWIKRYIALNPPADLIFGIDQLDNFYNAPSELPENLRYSAAKMALLKIITLVTEKYDVKKGLPFTEWEAKYLIGLSYRQSLREIIYAGMKREDLGLLSRPASKLGEKKAFDEIAHFSFRDYYEKVVRTYFVNHPELEVMDGDIEKYSNLFSQEETLRNNPKVRMVHNRDDFLLKTAEFDRLKELMGDRIVMFDKGGHLGNLNHPEYIAAIVKALESK